MCGSCGATIRWAITCQRKRMPIDPEPTRRGNVVLQPGTGPKGEDIAYVLAGERLAEAKAAGVELRTSHFATCPQAAEWRSANPRRRR